MKEIVIASDLVKIYGKKEVEFKALDGVNLTIREGDFIGIMGPSGSGKSTFLNIISTVDRPTKGRVEINGKNVTSLSETDISKFRYENIGFIFQEFNLIDSLTVRDNIAVPLVLASKDKEFINKRVEEIAARLELTMYLDKFPIECSGGQRQRAACARALVAEPKMIVADEPTGNLDSKNSHELLKLLQELNENDGVTILMVTHDSMIASYTKKLVFIRDGKIDTELQRDDLSQKEYFYKIVDITSKESQNLFDTMK
ncbi:MAG: ABC transporter ATP-binding protein [Clostridium sp.]